MEFLIEPNINLTDKLTGDYTGEICKRCGKIHPEDNTTWQDIFNQHAESLAKAIDQELIRKYNEELCDL